MKVEVLNRNNTEATVLVEDVTAAFANALRRAMMIEIPTMAIEWVDFVKNDSALADELLANRLGQVPLTFDRQAYDLQSECKCEDKGCSRCQVKLTLSKKGPCMVYSEDLNCRSKDVKPVFDKIPIVELFENQEVQLEAVAMLGTGMEHAKWQAAVVGYSNVPNISIDSKACKGEKCAKCVAKCVKGVLRSGSAIKITDPMKCSMCLQCVDNCPEGAIKVGPDENRFIFNIESVSALTPEEIVIEAKNALEKKVKEFEKGLRKIK